MARDIFLGVFYGYKALLQVSNVRVDKPIACKIYLDVPILYLRFAICKVWNWDLSVFSMLQICGLFLAFATRKVKVKGLDDAKWIAATIYITSIVLAIIILAVYTLNDLSNTHSAVFTGGIFIGTTFIMAFVFVPKVAIHTTNFFQENSYYFTFYLGVLFRSTWTHSACFFFQMYTLYKDPKGTKVFGKSGPSDPADKSSFEHSGRRVSESMQGDKKGTD